MLVSYHSLTLVSKHKKPPFGGISRFF
jgi:hypothetical protein